MSDTQRLVILGTGHIAHRHATEFARDPRCRMVAAVDLNADRARAFAERYDIPHVFGDLEAALRWGAFDAAVNATPDAAHKPTTLALLADGKHVFCEKPLALTGPDAYAMAEAAEAANRLNMVNFTYRNAHAIQMARTMVASGSIGAVRHLEASYLQSWLSAGHWGDWRTEERWLWRLSTSHGSNGVLGDLGVHLFDFVSFGTGLAFGTLVARLKTFGKAPDDRIGEYLLDANDSVAITAEMSNGALCALHMSRFATGNLNDLNLAVFGDAGALRIWANHLDSRLHACLGDDRETQTWRLLTCPPTPRNEIRFATALATGANGEPDFRRAADIQTLIDLCTASDADGRWREVAPVSAAAPASRLEIEAGDEPRAPGG
ncbi:MAG: Gfo/Idh/MocA family oxidoreductase [Acetobacteraceae bacterium]|nr:Gfo/Idh/MocA family oxidoreductase [Acetobacteraceae bacterium]